MKIKVKFYADFKKTFFEEQDIELGDRAKIKDLLAQVCDTDERRKEILDSSGKAKPSVVVVLKRDSEDSKVVDSEYTELKDGDVVMVLRAVFGG